MKPVDSETLELLWRDEELRENRVREVVMDRLAENPPPRANDAIVVTYFLALRTLTLQKAAGEISYHATSGIKQPPPNSLLEECTGKAVGIDCFDATGRLGLLHMAYPLKMLRQADGHLTSVDILHTAAGAIIFDVYENQDACLVALQIPDEIIATFPGPAYGPLELRRIAGFAADEPAFGTILKPTAGITPTEVGTLVGQAAECPLFLFVKEDENLYPRLDYSRVDQRTRQAVMAIERARQKGSGSRGLIFAPHITGAPHEILETAMAAIEAGATGLMFSESFAGGTVRLIREATRQLAHPPAIYGHNAGIGVRSFSIWREIIDFLARLDGIDFRQTAPVRPGAPYIRPYGAEWRASEQALTRPIGHMRPTMIARAGGLDQGNILLNLEDAEARGLSSHVLFLAGSAINSIKNAQGQADARLGAEAMQQALDVHQSGELRGVGIEEHLRALIAVAERRKLAALREALRQRYPGVAA